MLLVAFILIIFFFLIIGATAFVICILIPTARAYALSIALWFATWGPCVVALLTLSGVALVTAALTTTPGTPGSDHVIKLLQTLGSLYAIVGIICTCAISSAAAWLHQKILQRLPFVLFRIYAALITAGIGSVFGWCFSQWITTTQTAHPFLCSLLVMFLLVAGFGLAAFRYAVVLRNEPPQTFALPTDDLAAI